MLVAGVLVLVLGVAFFVKYAFDRRGYQLYGRMVAGGGLAILYLSAYAGSALYGLLPPGVALAWMAVLSGVTVATADRQDSIGRATMAIALAFAAPILVSTGQDHHIVLFAYDAGLVVATFLLVRRHDWLLLAPWHGQLLADVDDVCRVVRRRLSCFVFCFD